MTYGIFSILPILLVLTLAFWKKNVFTALIAGLIVASAIVSLHTADYLIGF